MLYNLTVLVFTKTTIHLSVSGPTINHLHFGEYVMLIISRLLTKQKIGGEKVDNRWYLFLRFKAVPGK